MTFNEDSRVKIPALLLLTRSVVCKNFENKYFLYFYLEDYFRFAQAKIGNTFANMNKGDFSSASECGGDAAIEVYGITAEPKAS